AISMGVFYLLAGVLGMAFVSLFSAVPAAVVMTIAGLAVMPALMNSLTTAMADSDTREAALLTFLFTASGIEFFGIGSAFWGVSLGLFCFWLNQWQTRAVRA
ncbi:benzoate/H(+) symporter BenE family transporter, partial [Vibrio genomosp. F10]